MGTRCIIDWRNKQRLGYRLIPTFAATACFYTLFSWLCSAKLGNVVQAKYLDLRRPYFGLCYWCYWIGMMQTMTRGAGRWHRYICNSTGYWLAISDSISDALSECRIQLSVSGCAGFNLLFVWLLTHTFAPLLDLPVHYGRCVLLYHKANSIYLTICRQTDNFIYIEIGSIIIR